MIGTLLLFKKEKLNLHSLNFILLISSSIMFFISIIELIPNAFITLNNYYSFFKSTFICLLFISLGIYCSITLDQNNSKNTNPLYSLGIFSMFAMVSHNILEGIITYLTFEYNPTITFSLIIAIILHNIPEGIIISLPIYYGSNNKSQAFFYTLIASFSESIGAILSSLFLYKFINEYVLSLLFLLVAGLMLHISIIKILTDNAIFIKSKIFIFIIINILFILFHFFYH